MDVTVNDIVIIVLTSPVMVARYLLLRVLNPLLSLRLLIPLLLLRFLCEAMVVCLDFQRHIKRCGDREVHQRPVISQNGAPTTSDTARPRAYG